MKPRCCSCVARFYHIAHDDANVHLRHRGRCECDGEVQIAAWFVRYGGILAPLFHPSRMIFEARYAPLQHIAAMLATTHILVVDDDELFRDMLVVMLRHVRPQYVVTAAQHGQDAYTWHQHHHAHMILTDDIMPLMTGMALLQQLRAEHDYVPVIVLTSRYTSRLELQPDACTVIASKPITIPQLLNHIDRLLITPH